MTDEGYNRRRRSVDWYYALWSTTRSDIHGIEYVNDCIDADYYGWERPDTVNYEDKAMIKYFERVWNDNGKIPAGTIGSSERWIPAKEYFG